ncbi:HAD phosphatase [Amylocystis lapponica]|nr:HAD phosphatase [Amylocystis lapponica]
MPLNIPGLLVPLHLIVHPRLLVPSLIIKDIRQLDFPELHRAGYRGAVFDKDNCLTVPHRDTLVPELQDAWRECRETFGEGNVLVVSNSAGSHLDAGDIQAESVAHHLSVPVLRHSSLKPSYSCIKSIRAYFASLPKPVRDEELIIVGDRIFTDVVMANRMARRQLVSRDALGINEKTAAISPTRQTVGPLAVWTEGVWQRESMFVRWMETSAMHGVQRWIVGGPSSLTQVYAKRFVRELPVLEAVAPEGLLRKLWDRVRRR